MATDNPRDWINEQRRQKAHEARQRNKQRKARKQRQRSQEKASLYDDMLAKARRTLDSHAFRHNYPGRIALSRECGVTAERLAHEYIGAIHAGRCRICDRKWDDLKKLDPKVGMSMDLIRYDEPLYMQNLQIICGDCNARKLRQHPLDFELQIRDEIEDLLEAERAAELERLEREDAERRLFPVNSEELFKHLPGDVSFLQSVGTMGPIPPIT